jgi:ubiquitin carboxyl-terminal hydrolase 20/33
LASASTPQQARTGELRVHLVEDFSLLMTKSWGGKFRLCVPKDLLQSILALNPYFRGYGQHDSQEYIRSMLDQLHEAIKCKVEYEFDLRRAQQQAEQEEREAIEREKQAAAAEQNAGDTAGASPAAAASPAAKVSKKRYPESSIINDLFSGVLESSVRCSNCGFVSVTRDPFMDLQLEIPKEQQLKKIGAERGSDALTPQVNRGFFSSVGAMLGLSTPTLSLATCLHSFCTSDNLLHKDQYKCERCKVKVDAVKILALDPASLPEVLIITIKRFSHNSYFGSKLSRHVTFPLRGLDMAPFLAQPKPAQSHSKGAVGRPNGTPASSAAAAAASPSSTSSSSTYDLFAIVRHLGSVSGGHYIAYCRSHVTGKWFEFDDRVVTEFSEAEIAKIEAYVLFYKRVHPVEPLRRVLRLVEESTVRDPLAVLSAASSTPTSAGGHVSKPLRYVSRYWLKKMEVLGHPMPIDNRDLCCSHGMPQSLPSDGGDRAVAITAAGWERLFRELGGGPIVDSAEAAVCEQCELPRIRKEERARIAKVDALAASQPADGSSSYLMIHSGWLQEWRAFVQDKGPRPGPISNEHLFEADGRTLLADLKRGEHYRALHGMVWNALHEIYGGGPRIERAALDIYAPPMKTRRASSRKLTEDDAAAAANEAQQQQETQAEEQQEQEPEAGAEESPQAMQEDTPQPEQQEQNA